MPYIHISDVTFAYEGQETPLFDHISLQIDTRWKLGLTGRNGRGKTTLLRLMCGELSYTGSIRSDCIIRRFPPQVTDPAWLTWDVLEECAAGIPGWQIQRECTRLGITEEMLYRPFGTLSGGEQTRALLAVSFLQEDCFLLLDEPTGHLDGQARQLVAEFLARQKGFLLVSHDRALLDGCVDHMLGLNRSSMTLQKGNFSTWWETMEQKQARELEENQKLRREIDRLAEASRRTANWSDKVEQTKNGTRIGGLRPDKGHIGHKAEKMMRRSRSIAARQEAAMEQKAALLHDVETMDALKLPQLLCRGTWLVGLHQVQITYDPSHPVCHPVQLTLEPGEQLALCGANGCGKSSLLRLICGEEVPHTGDVYRQSGLRISYAGQDPSHLKGSIAAYAETLGADQSLLKTILRKLGFERWQLETDMDFLSMGQKKKVLLAGSLCTPAHVFAWDEPLGFLDVFSRIQLEQLLLQAKPTLLFVEHDAMFTERIAARCVEITATEDDKCKK